MLGFALGGLLGAVFGYALGLLPTWEKVLSPYILALQIAPKVAFAPLFILWFGYNAWPKLIVTILVVFFPIMVNVLQAMRTMDRDLINLARAYNMTRTQIFLKVMVPCSMPNLMAGLRIGATLAVIGITVGELVGGEQGLGYLISFGQGQANTAMVFDAIGLLTVIGILMYWAIAAVEARILHYAPRARRAATTPVVSRPPCAPLFQTVRARRRSRRSHNPLIDRPEICRTSATRRTPTSKRMPIFPHRCSVPRGCCDTSPRATA